MSDCDPEIYKKAIPFGEPGNDPRAARAKSKPWSIRNAIKRVANMNAEEIAQMMKDPNLTMAQLVALTKFQMATKGRNVKAQQQIEDSVDGRIVQASVSANISLAEIIAKSYDKKYLESDEPDESGVESSE